jgi:hypothetical protein
MNTRLLVGIDVLQLHELSAISISLFAERVNHSARVILRVKGFSTVLLLHFLI